MNIIEMKQVVRYFKSVRGVDGLDLEVKRGSVLGLLGENGSGKTTAIRLAMGLLVPNEGQMTTFGFDPLDMPVETRARIAYVADEMELPGWMRLREGMDLYASYFSQWRQSVADELLKRFTLDPAWKFGGLNKGHKRRFFLMLAIAQQPDLIVLDEPAGGLDPLVRNEFLDLLLEVGRERNVTILISSHILSDVERIIDEVAFIRDGRRLLQANLEDLKTRVKRIWVPNGELPRVKERFNVIAEEAKSNGWLVAVDDFDATQLDGLESDLQHLNLEDLFMFYNETAAVEETGA